MEDEVYRLKVLGALGSSLLSVRSSIRFYTNPEFQFGSYRISAVLPIGFAAETEVETLTLGSDRITSLQQKIRAELT